MLRTRLIAGPASGFVLSAVVATALTVLSFGEALFEPWRVDPAVPALVTLRLPRTTLQTYDAGSGRHAAMRSRLRFHSSRSKSGGGVSGRTMRALSSRSPPVSPTNAMPLAGSW